jgi:bifunctional DNA-binding transcriptional regulator/antitoxin component of YhaV-PrlF toxin-antitoxin module
MLAVEVKLTTGGRITLPIELRERLKVQPGDGILFSEGRDGRIFARGRSESLSDMQGVLRGMTRVTKFKSVERWIDEARSRQFRHAVRRVRRGKR